MVLRTAPAGPASREAGERDHDRTGGVTERLKVAVLKSQNWKTLYATYSCATCYDSPSWHTIDMDSGVDTSTYHIVSELRRGGDLFVFTHSGKS